MARHPKRTAEQWEAIARAAIQALLVHREVAPWSEIESRIGAGWKDFPPVQPLQLSGARAALRQDGSIEEDHTNHPRPITTLRFPIQPGDKRRIQRLTGKKRKIYRKYLGWAGDHDLCGKQGERAVFASLQAASTDAGLWVPPQTLGDLREIDGALVQPGPLDLLAWILNLEAERVVAEVPMIIEVKNTRGWIYPNAPELWQLLVKAAGVAASRDVLPMLACMRSAFPTFQMAKDIGFFACELREQVFSLRVPEEDILTIREEFGLPIVRTEGPLEGIVSFLKKTLRRKPPPTPNSSATPWYRQQVERFSAIASIVLDHSVLAEDTDSATRRRAFDSFRGRVIAVADWDLSRGW